MVPGEELAKAPEGQKARHFPHPFCPLVGRYVQNLLLFTAESGTVKSDNLVSFSCQAAERERTPRDHRNPRSEGVQGEVLIVSQIGSEKSMNGREICLRTH